MPLHLGSRAPWRGPADKFEAEDGMAARAVWRPPVVTGAEGKPGAEWEMVLHKGTRLLLTLAAMRPLGHKGGRSKGLVGG